MRADRPVSGARCATMPALRCCGVAAEQLVGTLAGQGDGHVLRGQLAQRVEAERREISERLVQMPRELLERHGVLVMESSSSWCSVSEPLGDGARGGQLVAGSSAKPTENVFTGWSICRAISATIRLESSPPRQHRAERHVAHQAQRDRLVELVKQPLSGLRRATSPPVSRADSPERLDGDSVVDDQPVPRRQLPDSLRAASVAPGSTRASGTRPPRPDRSERRRGRSREAILSSDANTSRSSTTA